MKKPWDEVTAKTFVDYKFTLDKFGNLWQDEELTLASLDAELGECFVLTKQKDRLVLIKLKKPYSVIPYTPQWNENGK